MIQKSAFAFIILMLAVAASPATASGVPAGTTMMPMNGMPMGNGNQQGSGCNCNIPVQAAAAPPATSATPRSSGGQEPSPCSGSGIPVLNGTPGSSGRVGGIRRIYPKNVLDHPECAAVYNAIVARPRIDTAGIAAELGMNRETLRYHLDKLEAATRVVVMRDRGIVRYFENHGRYTLLERTLLQHLWNSTGREILTLIASRPRITQAEISIRIAVTTPTVRWYLQRFCEDSIITEQRDGKYVRYAAVPETGKFLAVHASDMIPAVAAV